MTNSIKPQVINIKDAPGVWEYNDDYVYIGRKMYSHGISYPGYFGNPFTRKPNQPRGSTLEAYELWARRQIESNEIFRENVKKLAGKVLVCFCAPHPCHGDVLATLCEELNAGIN